MIAHTYSTATCNSCSIEKIVRDTVNSDGLLQYASTCYDALFIQPGILKLRLKVFSRLGSPSRVSKVAVKKTYIYALFDQIGAMCSASHLFLGNKLVCWGIFHQIQPQVDHAYCPHEKSIFRSTL
jgi:hypothetical protein